MTEYRKHVAIILASCFMIFVPLFFNIGSGEHVYPEAFKNRPLPDFCLLKKVTGLPCPTCGFTRSFISVTRLNLPAAIKYNAAAVLLYLYFLFQIPYRTFLLFNCFQGLKTVFKKKLGYACLGVFCTVLAAGWGYTLFSGNF